MQESFGPSVAPYEECQILQLNFQLSFGQSEFTMVKTRRFLRLYSNDPNAPSIYLALLTEVPRSAGAATEPREIFSLEGTMAPLLPMLALKIHETIRMVQCPTDDSVQRAIAC